MRYPILLFCLLLQWSTVFGQSSQPFWLGADISGTTQLEAFGQQLFNSQGEITENTALMHQYGLNAVRLRVWVNPRGGFCGKEDVLAMAKRARYYGMAVMIDFHYSDWWADPGKQHIPGAWQYLKYDEMRMALALYPVSMKQIMDIADSGNIMPPKATWFEPKLRSGLVIHKLV